MRRLSRFAIGAGTFFLMWPIWGQTINGISSKQADDILTELRAIRLLLTRSSFEADANRPPEREKERSVVLDITGANRLGKPQAPITIVEFSDFKCPFCRQFHESAFGDIRKTLVDTGRVRFVTMDFPLAMHPGADLVAEAVRCAGDSGKYWEAYDFAAKRSNHEGTFLKELADNTRVDIASLVNCVESHKHRGDVTGQIKAASAVGIDGVPSFVVGKSASDKVDGVVLVGSQSLEFLEGIVQRLERP
jgi:protein-disulfide isomerase